MSTYTDEQARVLERVRKLLALAENAAASEGERDNALRMAYNTLAKHNLDIADARTADVSMDPRGEHHMDLVGYPYVRSICSIIAGLFFCDYYYTQRHGKQVRHSFVGRTSNAVTAAELSQHVINSVFKEMRQRYGSTSTAETRAFAIGVVNKLRRRVHDIKAAQVEEQRAAEAPAATAGSASRALMLVDLYASEALANAAYIEQLYGKLRVTKGSAPVTREHADSYAAGQALGSRIGLSPSIAANKKAPQLR